MHHTEPERTQRILKNVSKVWQHFVKAITAYGKPWCNIAIFGTVLAFPTSESFASSKRSGARGFHEGIFDQGFGGFSTLKKRGGSRLEAVRAAASRLKRRPEMTSRGIHGDAFTGDIVDLQ